MLVKTSSWFTPLPAHHVRIGISRGVPRGQVAGYRRYTRLNPGGWFNSVSPAEYLARYNAEILAPLDPRRVVDDLATLAGDRVPVLLCFEDPRSIAEGRCWCHRHLVAQWLEDRLDVVVEEVGHPLLPRWERLRTERVPPPSYR